MAVYFVERSLGSDDVPSGLREAGLEVRIHDDLFEQDALDTEWIAAVAQNGWVVLTKDKKIRYRRLELRAVRTSKARMFTLATGDLNGQQMADAFIAARAPMNRFLRKHAGPFIAKVYREGRVRAWWP